jgi:hypothetical protein
MATVSRLAARPRNALECGGMADLRGGGAAGWASELAWWAEPPSPEPDSRAQSLAKQESSARPYSQQGAVLSIQLVDSIIAGSIQIC